MAGPGSHRFFSASAASRWMACPASAVIDTSAFPDRSSAAADRGTLLHAEAERQLRALFHYGPSEPTLYAPLHRPVELPLPVPPSFTPEDVETVRGYVDYVASVPGFHLFEFQSEFLPGVGGTADAVIIHLGDELLEVIDLKTGYHRVDPRENLQLSVYALGVLAKLDGIFDFERVRITIFQPAASPDAMHWEIPVEKLREIGEHIRAQVEEIVGGYAPFSPGGDTCRWCRAKPICPALAGQSIAAAQDDFRDDGGLDWEPGAEALEQEAERAAASDEDPEAAILAMKAAQIAIVRTWADAVEAELRSRLLSGGHVPGWKVVAGRKGNRAWALEEGTELEMRLRQLNVEPFGPRPFVGPAQAEKLIKGHGLDPKTQKAAMAALRELVKEGAPGSPTVVPEGDRRPAIEKASLAADDFRETAEEEIE